MNPPYPPPPYGQPPYPPPPIAWAEGPLLVTARQASVAGRCFRCGAPSTTVKTAKLSWHDPVWYVLVALSPLVYAIVALAISKRARIDIGLCEQHHKNRKLGTAIGLGGLLGGIASFPLAIALDMPALLGLGFVGLAAGIIALAARKWPAPTRMDDHRVWIRNADPRFLANLPYALGPAPGQLPRAYLPK